MFRGRWVGPIKRPLALGGSGPLLSGFVGGVCVVVGNCSSLDDVEELN